MFMEKAWVKLYPFISSWLMDGIMGKFYFISVIYKFS